MTVKQIISQVEILFGRQPEAYIIQLVNDAFDDIASNKQSYTVSSLTDLKKKQRWYSLDDQVIDVMRVEIKDTNDRYVMIPKLADSHRILREDTDSNTATWTSGSSGSDDSLT